MKITNSSVQVVISLYQCFFAFNHPIYREIEYRDLFNIKINFI